jgi:hypothetical protein
MSIPELLSTIVLGIPNFAVAFWAVYWQHKTITALLKANQALVDLCTGIQSPPS